MRAYFLSGKHWIQSKKGLDIHRYGFVAEVLMERHSEYYLTNLVAPLFVVVLTGLFVVFLPADSGHRIDLSVTVLLGFTFVQTIIASLLPKTDQIPLLARYVVWALVLSLVSVFANVLLFGLSTRYPPSTRPIGLLVPLSFDVGEWVNQKVPLWRDRVRLYLMQRFGFLWPSQSCDRYTSTYHTMSELVDIQTSLINNSGKDVVPTGTSSHEFITNVDKEAESSPMNACFKFPLVGFMKPKRTTLESFLSTRFGTARRESSSPSVMSSSTNDDCFNNIECSYRQLCANLNRVFAIGFLFSHALVFVLYFRPFILDWIALAVDRGNWWEKDTLGAV